MSSSGREEIPLDYIMYHEILTEVRYIIILFGLFSTYLHALHDIRTI